MFGSSGSSAASHTGTRGGIVVDGVDLIVSDFMREATAVRPRAARVVVKHADRAAQRMRDLVPVDEGDLLDSVTSDASASTDGHRVWADAGPDVSQNPGGFKGHLIERGTVDTAPQPFVGPAGDQTLPEFVADVRGLPKL